MKVVIELTTDDGPAKFAVTVKNSRGVYRLGLCGLWEGIEPGAPWWRVWLFENREPGRGGILGGLIRWTYRSWWIPAHDARKHPGH